ncbi:MAG: MFS transporter [Cyanobacteria bacterium M_surface_9_m1_291]|nr:MFS transporter [Cyanobacteria bacterium M_surface_9_m1_291]
MSPAAQASPQPRGWLPAPVALALLIVILIAFIGESIPLLIVDLRQQMGLTSEQAGLIRFAPAAAGLLLAPSTGGLADALGARKVLMTALSMIALGALLIATSSGLPLFTCGLLVSGVGELSTTIVAYSLVTKAAKDAKQLAIYSSIWAITWQASYLVCPPIIAAILSDTDRSWPAIGATILTASMTLIVVAGKLTKNPTARDAAVSSALPQRRNKPSTWEWKILLGIIFSLTTSIPILDVVKPSLTPILLSLDIGLTALLAAVIKGSREIQKQLSFFAKPILVLATLALAATYLVDWNYYTERFITLRYSLNLHQASAWVTPFNIASLLGATCFGGVSLRLGVLKSTLGCTLIWLATPFIFILTTTSAPIALSAAAIGFFTLVGSFAFTGIQSFAASQVPNDNRAMWASIMVGINTIVKSAGGALTSDVMMSTYQEALRNKLSPLPLSGDLIEKIIQWLTEGKFHLVLENDYNIPAFIINTYLTRTAPERLTAYTSCLHALGYLCLGMVMVVSALLIASALLQRRLLTSTANIANR